MTDSQDPNKNATQSGLQTNIRTEGDKEYIYVYGKVLTETQNPLVDLDSNRRAERLYGMGSLIHSRSCVCQAYHYEVSLK